MLLLCVSNDITNVKVNCEEHFVKSLSNKCAETRLLSVQKSRCVAKCTRIEAALSMCVFNLCLCLSHGFKNESRSAFQLMNVTFFSIANGTFSVADS